MTRFGADDFACLAMYPQSALIEAWDAVYAAVALQVDGAPAGLRWDLKPHETWLSPNLALGMTCGWPLVTELRDQVRTIGAFVHRIDRTASHLYRSVIVSNRMVDLADLSGLRAAINSADSLSGSISLLGTLPGAPTTWPGDVTWTGSHIDSVAEVQSYGADVASIDGLTWAYLRRDAPRSVAGLVVVGHGPTVPTLPLITAQRAGAGLVAEWRAALARAVRDRALADALATLMIEDFVPLDLADYDTALRSKPLTMGAL